MRFACLTLVLSVLSLAKPAVPQTKAPGVLLQALHCARTSDFDLLDARFEKDHTVQASFTHYVETGPDVDGFVVVIYESDLKGEVLDYVREVEHGKVQLYIVNNASFSLSKNNVLSVDDALGGIWTQGHLKMRVKRAMQTKYSIPSNKLAAPFQNVSCHYYWSAP